MPPSAREVSAGELVDSKGMLLVSAESPSQEPAAMVKPALRTKSIGFKVSEEEYVQLDAAAQTSGRSLGECCREVLLSRVNGQEPKAAVV